MIPHHTPDSISEVCASLPVTFELYITFTERPGWILGDEATNVALPKRMPKHLAHHAILPPEITPTVGDGILHGDPVPRGQLNLPDHTDRLVQIRVILPDSVDMRQKRAFGHPCNLCGFDVRSINTAANECLYCPALSWRQRREVEHVIE